MPQRSTPAGRLGRAPEAAPDLEIYPLTPKRLPDLAALFGQGGDPKWCWYTTDVSSESEGIHMTAIGYIRQSRRADLDVAMSPAQQRADILEMAKRDGLEDVRILEDLGRSGGEGKERLRSAYRELLEAIDSGALDTIYAKNQSRLGRSFNEVLRVYELAADKRIRLVLRDTGEQRFETAMQRATVRNMAAFGALVRELAVEAANENVAVRRARGDRMGRAPYGEKPSDRPGDVVDAFRQTGSLNGTAQRLNTLGLPSPLNKEWTAASVRLVLQRSAPEFLPRRPSRGVKPSSPFLLFRLLKCHCGTILTASRDGRGNRDPVYRCHRRESVADHGAYRVREGAILPWIQAEAAKLRTPERIQLAERNEQERAELVAQRERLGWALTDGLLDREQAQTRAAEIDGELERLNDQEAIVGVPQIDWSWSPGDLNAVLRAMWAHVEMNADMRPIRAAWRIPEWRAD